MIHAVVIGENDTANLRINQIEMPDGTFDGPFERSLQYKIKAPGTYKLNNRGEYDGRGCVVWQFYNKGLGRIKYLMFP